MNIAFADIAIKNSANAFIEVTAAAGGEICNILTANSMRCRNIAWSFDFRVDPKNSVWKNF